MVKTVLAQIEWTLYPEGLIPYTIEELKRYYEQGIKDGLAYIEEYDGVERLELSTKAEELIEVWKGIMYKWRAGKYDRCLYRGYSGAINVGGKYYMVIVPYEEYAFLRTTCTVATWVCYDPDIEKLALCSWKDTAEYYNCIVTFLGANVYGEDTPDEAARNIANVIALAEIYAKGLFVKLEEAYIYFDGEYVGKTVGKVLTARARYGALKITAKAEGFYDATVTIEVPEQTSAVLKMVRI